MPRESTVTLEELRGALVVSGAGKIVGVVDDVTVANGELVLSVCERKVVRRSVVDHEKLIVELLKLIGKRLRRPTIDDLYRRILEELRVPSVDEEALVKYAMTKNVPIPTREVEEVETVEVAKVPWSEVELLGKSDMGVCVVLKDGEEGRPPHMLKSELDGKLVVDARGAIIGVVTDVRFSAKGPNLEVAHVRRKVSEEVDAEELTRRLVQVTGLSREKLYKRVAKDLGIARLTVDDVAKWASNLGVPVPKRRTVEEVREVYPVVVPWELVRAIGDVVLLKVSIEKRAASDSG